MNNVVKIWDAYDNSHPTGAVVHAGEELRLKNEVERLNSTIAELEAERDEHLRTIEELKQARAVSATKKYNPTRKKMTAADNTEAEKWKKLFAEEEKTLYKWVRKMEDMTLRIYKEGACLLRESKYDTENRIGKIGIKMMSMGDELTNLMLAREGEK